MVAALCSLLVGGSILTFICLRAFAPGASELSTAEATVIFMFRLSALRIIIGLIGVVASFATVSSTLTLASGAVCVATMRDLKSSIEISHGRSPACSHPVHAVNLSIAAIVIGLAELICSVILYVLVLPNFYDISFCVSTAYYYDSGCSYYYSESYAEIMLVL